MSEIKVLELDYMHSLAERIKASSDSQAIRNDIQYALDFYSIINFDFKYENPFFRARITNDGRPFTCTSEIYYPPHNVAKAGRLNENGSPALYLSLTCDVALAEVKAKEGDIVQVSAFRTKRENEGIRVALIGEKYKSVKGGNQFLSKEVADTYSDLVKRMSLDDRRMALAYLYSDMFFDEIITNPNAHEKNYIHSRIMADLIFNRNKYIDGIMYYSIASNNGMNIALPWEKADQHLALESTALIKIKKVYPYGLYDIEFIKKPKSFNKNGKIIW